jgi:uncharacterized protein YciI
MQRRTVLALAAAAVVGAPTLAAAAAAPPTYFVLTHAPGPSWDHAKGFREQPGVEAHLGYMSGYADKGRIVMGGPFLDNSGGMMIFDVATLDGARAIAEADPTVKSGLLTVTVKPWLAVLARK